MQLHDTFHEQRGTDQQNDRERDLSHEQERADVQRAQNSFGTFGIPGFPAGAQISDQIGPGRAERRRQSEEHAGR